jgi:3-oxoacyl-[acyl-carrier-protein] synthase II
MERVVVTGLGVASPLGCTVAEFWNGLLDGRSGVVAWRPGFAGLRTRIGARVSFDGEVIRSKAARLGFCRNWRSWPPLRPFRLPA